MKNKRATTELLPDAEYFTARTQLGAALREARRANGLTQEMLAARLGTTQGRINHWETGRGAPHAVELPIVARALGTDPHALLGWTQLKDSKDSKDRLRQALRFYADARRYQGPNQSAFPDDPYTAPSAAYMTDVSRDGGQIARDALRLRGGSK